MAAPIMLWGSSNISGPWDPSLAGLLLTVLLSGDEATSLDNHFSLITQEKILHGEYVNAFFTFV